MAPTDPRITKAKRIGAAAVKRAAELQTEPGVNRSTATRKAYKVKAEALDAMLAALNPSARPAAKRANGAARTRSRAKSKR